MSAAQGWLFAGGAVLVAVAVLVGGAGRGVFDGVTLAGGVRLGATTTILEG